MSAPQLSAGPLGSAKFTMKIILSFIFILIVPSCFGQESNSTLKEYTGPYEFMVEPTYSGIDEIGINLDSCTIVFDSNSKIVTIRGILIDRSTLERIPCATVAIGIDSIIDKVGSHSCFNAIDTIQTDNLGRFDVSSKIVDQHNATFTFSFPGYFRYYLKLEKILLSFNKP